MKIHALIPVVLLGWPLIQRAAGAHGYAPCGTTEVASDCSAASTVLSSLRGVHTAISPAFGIVPGAAPVVAFNSPEPLRVEPGIAVVLELLTLVNPPMADPFVRPTLLEVSLGNGSSLTMTSVAVLTSRAAVETHARYFNQRVLPERHNTTFIYTDNATFLHLNWWRSGEGVSVRSFSLLAAPSEADLTDPEALGARLLLGTNASALEGTYGDVPLPPPPQMPLSYLLSATNTTLVPLLTQHAAVRTRVPLLVLVTDNVTVCCKGTLLPITGLALNRPVVFVGSPLLPVSMDFRLEASTLNMSEPTGAAAGAAGGGGHPRTALVWDSLVLENLPHGDESSIPIARGSNLDFSYNMWMVWGPQDSVMKQVRNCTVVLPSPADLNYMLYWGTAYNSPLPFFQEESAWIRLRLSITSWEMEELPTGDGFLLVSLNSARANNSYVTVTTVPQVAPPAPVPSSYDQLAPNKPGAIYHAVNTPGELQDLLPRLTNVSDRQQIVLLSHDMTWGEAPANPASWPPPGGMPVPVPLELAGRIGGAAETGETTFLDVGGARDVVRVPPGAEAGHLQLTGVVLAGLPQGPAAQGATELVADVWTLLMWCIARPDTPEGSVQMRAVRLLVAAPEVAALQQAAAAGPSFVITPAGLPWSVVFDNVTPVAPSAHGGAAGLRIGSMRARGLVAQGIEVVEDANTTRAMPAGYTWPAAAPLPPPAPGGSDGGGGGSLGTWQVALLAVCCVTGVSLLAAVVFLLVRRRRRRRTADAAIRKGHDDEDGQAAPPPPPGSGPPSSASSDGRVLCNAPGAAAAQLQGGADAAQRSRDGSSQKGLRDSVNPSSGGGAAGGRGGAASTQGEGEPGGVGALTWRRLHAAIHHLSADLQQRRIRSVLPLHHQPPGSAGASSLVAAASSAAAIAPGGGSAASAAGGEALALPSASSPARALGSTVGGASSATGAGSAAAAAAASVGADPSRHQQQQQQQELALHTLLGSGTFGSVYSGTWRGTAVAVKVMQLRGGALAQMQLPGSGGGGSGVGGPAAGTPGVRGAVTQHQAVKEAAISAAMSHPNIVQVYTYMLKPLHPAAPHAGGSRRGDEGSGDAESAAAGWELRLVMELCDQGTLRGALDEGLLTDASTGRPHHPTVLALAYDVACAMLHLHSEGVLHGDLKASNVLLKHSLGAPSLGAAGDAIGGAQPAAAPPDSAAGGGGLRGEGRVTAKVADFGLSLMVDPTETHVSHMHGGTLTHMAPEILLLGRASKASDVYAYGVLLWELGTGARAFAGTPRALLGHQVAQERRRPTWPALPPASPFAGGAPDTELRCRSLAERCWSHNPAQRPSFAEVVEELRGLLEAVAAAEWGASSSAAGSRCGDDSLGGSAMCSWSLGGKALVPFILTPAPAPAPPQEWARRASCAGESLYATAGGGQAGPSGAAAHGQVLSQRQAVEERPTGRAPDDGDGPPP